jgi:hypothetical protein
MVALNEDQQVREIRMFWQHAAKREFRKTVERITIARCGPSCAVWTCEEPPERSSWAARPEVLPV